jgi:alpha-glucosidase
VRDRDGRPGQWYLHLFAPEQPDFNWDNAAVREEFESVLRFWFDRGVDGMRVDAAPAFVKHPALPDFGLRPDAPFAVTEWTHSPFWDLDGVHDIFRKWRHIADTYAGDRMFVGEVDISSPERLARYVRPDEFHTALNLPYLKGPWDATSLRTSIDATLATLEPVGAPATWVMSSHDETRHLTRYGRADTSVGMRGVQPEQATDVRLGTLRSRAAALLMLALPGSAYVYQGEELGLWEIEDLPDDVLQDPIWTRSNRTIRGRDGCRVPIPWSGDEPPFGFSTSGQSWLPPPKDWRSYTVENQAIDPDSMFALYRQALGLRRAHPGLRGGSLSWCEINTTGILAFDRGHGLRCVVNLSTDHYPLTGRGLLVSAPLAGDALPPDSAAWLQVP